MTREQFLSGLSPDARRQFNSLSQQEQADILFNVAGGDTPVDAKGTPSKADLVKDVAAGAGLHSVLSGMGGGATVATPEIVSVTAGPSGAFGAANVSAAAPAAPGMFSLGGIGSAGNLLLPAAGAYGLYDLMQDREDIGTGKGYLQGAASGAAIGSFFGPAGAVVGGGLGVLGNAFGIGGKSRTKVEQDRRSALKEQGIEVPNYDIKEWEENEAFRTSRDEKLLKGGDIENAAQFYGIEGYAGLDQAKKEAIAQKAIDDGLIREHHGTIDLSLTDAYKKYLDEQLGTGEVASSNNNQRREPVEQKRRKKKAILDSIMPPIEAEIPMGPRYDLNPGNLINNPYL